MQGRNGVTITILHYTHVPTERAYKYEQKLKQRANRDSL